ncbi:MFS transporter [Arthrobacter alpinus]|uniref:MFS transporter n=1 Tax=Arthrobacter alpinus TaxID=656366 RepID=UPI0005CB2B90|nr:MFS transporter [Arthrobacter alpinus]ALV45312.1 MFS transporter [Arthrobacter alpinus]
MPASPTSTIVPKDPTSTSRLPIAALILMALTGFIVIMTETLPAGLLPQIADAYSTTEGVAGQLVTVYALGTIVAAIPAIALTRGTDRKRLLLIGLLGFLVANTITALASTLALALVARFVAGAFSGLLWGMLAGYSRRIVSPEHAGRALAIAMTGTPLALSIGTPIGSWLGTVIGWRWSFAVISALTVIVTLLVLAIVPNASGQRPETQRALVRVLVIPGVWAILVVVFTWMLAHNLVYTYIAPYLAGAGAILRPDAALFIFGLAALLGIWLTGVFIDNSLRRLALVSTATFILAGVILILLPTSVPATVTAIALWGIGFGGASTQLQTAMGNAAGSSGDVANAMLTTAFNIAIFGGGALGAVLVDSLGATTLPIAMVLLSGIALVTISANRHRAFPR